MVLYCFTKERLTEGKEDMDDVQKINEDRAHGYRQNNGYCSLSMVIVFFALFFMMLMFVFIYLENKAWNLLPR